MSKIYDLNSDTGIDYSEGICIVSPSATGARVVEFPVLATDGGLKVSITSSPSTAMVAKKYPAADEDKEQVSAVATTLKGFDIYNPGASGVWLQIFNALAANVTVGSTAPDHYFYVPAESGRSEFWCNNHLAMSVGMTYAVTATYNGSGAVTDCQLTFYTV
jgi:hypothetical protein